MTAMPCDQTGTEAVLDLKRFLGPADDPTCEFSYARRVEQDETETLPEAALNLLDQWGMPSHYVPAAHGGKLTNFVTMASLIRTVSGRDLAVSISHAVSFLGSACIWIAGTPEQQRALADQVLAGTRTTFALTEKAHGSDLLAMETVATPVGDGFELEGEKWLINGIRLNPLVTVFARTDNAGPRAFSLFLLDKRGQAADVCEPLPKIETVGIRGSDIAGMRFNRARLAASDMIGKPGSGLETALKGLQLTRILCSALALGAAETGMSVTLDFAADRHLYGKTAAEIPQTQRLLTEAWAEMLIADRLSGLVLRCMQVAPEQASVHSAVTKYLVPALIEQAFQRMSTVMGARWYLRHEHADGIFQKMMRDNLLVGLFDGSSMVNLHALSIQLKALLSEHREATASDDWERAKALAARDAHLPDFDWARMSISSSGKDLITGGLELACAAVLARLKAEPESPCSGLLQDLIEGVSRSRSKLVQSVRSLDPKAQQAGDPVIFELARLYSVLAAASAILIEVEANPEPLQDPRQRAVLAVMLSRINALLGQSPDPLPAGVYRDAFDLLSSRKRLGQTIGTWHVPTADSSTPAHQSQPKAT